ncbi:MAG TPA: alkaline phosphatase D family protein [Gaiellaceae bacterium]|nr:alkaline phosphatase D family protein [Gaiellaceae bacterium]
MRLAAVTAIVFVVAAASSAAAAPFRNGVAAGDVTRTTAILWAQGTAAGPVRAEVLRGGRVVQRRIARATRASDLTVRVVARGLRAGARYTYRFRQGRSTSATGAFRTAPPAASGATVEFAISGDADGTPVRPGGPPFFNRFEVYTAMVDENNAFNVNYGDTIYSDSGVGGNPVARTVAQKWTKYKQNLALAPLRDLRRTAGVYFGWDDHEFINDFSRAEHGEDLYAAGRKAFLDYSPSAYSSRVGLYRSFRWGRHLELFILDGRSFRSAKASAGGVCNTGASPDLAPTAPQAVRNAFASLAPGLAQPVSPACLAVIRDPSRTFLGAAQYAAFTSATARSTATFKIVVNPTPLQQFYALPYDRWEGYEAERTRLVEFLRTNVRNVLLLTTDTHANLVGDVRVRTFEPPGPLDSGITEVITGPVATNTYAKEVDEELGATGVGQAIGALFLKPPLPRGIGMRCVALDVYGYAQVRVTSSQLTVLLKDANGEPVTDVSGEPCAPVVLSRR